MKKIVPLGHDAPRPLRHAMRAWLAATVAGAEPDWPFEETVGAEDLRSLAEEEGVAALVDWRLDAAAELRVPVPVRQSLAAAAREQAIRCLIRESACRTMLQRLEEAALDVLLLKGSALAYWAYAEPHLRDCVDIDVLLRDRASVDRALEALAPLGYAPREAARSGDMVSFELTCVRTAKGLPHVDVDLHWRLASTPLFAFRFDVEELWCGAISLPRLAAGARALAPVPAFLHACMHRVQNKGWNAHDTLKWLFDLHLIGTGFTTSQWHELTVLASSRGLAGACIDGIDAAAQAFGASAPLYAYEALRAAARNEPMDLSLMHRWAYIEWRTFRAVPGWPQRLRWLRQRAVPDLAYLRARYGDETGFLRMMVRRARAAFAKLR